MIINLQTIPRKQIRYVLFSLKDGTESKLAEKHERIKDSVIEHYSKQENFIDWDSFSEKWDVGTDEEHVLQNWDDPARLDKWYTWGIDKLKAVKNPGHLFRIYNKREGITRTHMSAMEYMVMVGYAHIEPKSGKYVLHIADLIENSGFRTAWNTDLETDISLKNQDEWSSFYRQPQNNLQET